MTVWLNQLIIPLAQLPLGSEASIAVVRTARAGHLQRLSVFGIVPGQRIRLRQLQPALIVQVGETELALDAAAGHEIFVQGIN